MSNWNENRPGYKKTRVGWIPEEWHYVFLSDVATVQTGLAKGKKNIMNPISLPYLRVANVQVEENMVERYLLRNGDILFTEGGDFDKLGRGTIWRDEIPKCLHQNHVFAVRCDTKKLLSYFLASIAASPHGRRYFLLSSKQSTNLASINTKQLKRFPLPLPSIFEQKKIAKILSTWDAAIEKTRNLIEAKKRRKKALMQQLLTGKKRLPAIDEDWKKHPMGELFKERRENNYSTSRFWQLQAIKASFSHRKSNGKIHPLKTSQSTNELCQVTLGIIRCECGREYPPFQLWKAS